MSILRLGDRVTILGTVRKEMLEGGTAYRSDGGLPSDWTGPKCDPQRIYTEGIIVGRRNYQYGEFRPQRGIFEYSAWPEYKFVTTGSITAYLVAFHLHRRHVMCLPEQLELLEENT